MRKVFLDDLPHTYKGVNWSKSIGYQVKFIYDDVDGKCAIINYNKNKQQLQLKYKNEMYLIRTCDFVRCRIGTVLNIIRSHKYKYCVGDIVNGLKIIKQIRIKHGKYTNKGYKYQCLKDNYVGIIDEYNLKNGVSCPVCTGLIAWIGHNDVETVRPDVLNWAINQDEIKNLLPHSAIEIECKCPICKKDLGKRKINDISNGVVACPYCSDGISYPNKILHNLVVQLCLYNNIKLSNFEHSEPWYKYKDMIGKTHKGYMDWYCIFNNKKYDIEMDGGIGHGHENTLSNQNSTESAFIDNQKDEIAKKYNVYSIRIDCCYGKQNILSPFEYIKLHIINKLCLIFDLTKIDWNEIEKSSAKSLVVESCNLWNQGIHSTSQIGNKLNIHSSTVIRYLKNGTEFGWCDYNPHVRRKIICVTTNIIYNSMDDAEQKTHVCKQNIYNCCKKKRHFAGRMHNGEPLKWMFLDEYMKQNGYTDISQTPNVIIHNESTIQ